MDRNCGIYCIICDVNGKLYIGQSIQMNKRINDHFKKLENNNHFNSHLQSAYNKYGKENFKWEVLKYCKKEKLDKLEEYYIKYYNSTNRGCGYNKTSKAHRTNIDADGRKKISETLKGRVFSKEWRKKISEKARGNKNGVNAKRSKEWKENMSKIHKGKKLSEETKKKLSEARKGKKTNLGYKWTEEQKKKLKTRNLGNKNALGYKWTNEQKERLSKAKRKNHLKADIEELSGEKITDIEVTTEDIKLEEE